jgi:Tol biopolymer transport system component
MEEQSLSSLWLRDLATGFESRVTPPGQGVVNGTVWSPDSHSVWFVMTSPQQGIYQQDRAGGSPELLQKVDTLRSLSDRNGRLLVYSNFNDPRTLGDIWYVPVESGKPGSAAVRVVGTDGSEKFGQLSPDGKWLAYRADEAGSLRVYIRPFPNGPGVWPVSGADAEHNLQAFEPRWSPNGKELYFLTGTGPVTLMAVAVEAHGHGGLQIGSKRTLFELRIPLNLVAANRWSYSPHPDGKRFLVNALVEAGDPTINVITNWQKAGER